MNQPKTSYQYEIHLEPMEPFMFGGENFQDLGKYFYLDRSMDRPQQTSILGMLRYELLKIKNLLPIHVHLNAHEIIGPSSFVPIDKDYSIGIIDRIGPVLLAKGDKRYFPMMAIEKDGRLQEPSFECSTSLGIESISLNGETKNQFYATRDYDPKKGAKRVFKNIDVSDDTLLESGAFYLEKEALQTFNTKTSMYGRENKTDLEGLYKLQRKELQKGCRFVFEVTLTEEIDLDNRFVTLGKKKSLFHMTAHKSRSHALNSLDSGGKFQKLVLVSDAYLDTNILWEDDELGSALMDFKSFRFLISSQSNGSYSDFNSDKFSKGTTNISRIRQRYNLIKAGSVLYFENKEKAEKVIKALAIGNWQKIGYNHFKTI